MSLILAIERTACAVVVFALLGCGRHPEPFGKLSRDKIADWKADCSGEIVEQPVSKGEDPTMSGRRDRTLALQQATHRFLCNPPGWAIYADSSDRIVGVCVDDDVGFPAPYERHVERARRILTKHFDSAIVSDMTKKCPYEPEAIGHDLLRWEQDLPAVQKPDGSYGFSKPVGTQFACCWEVTE